MASLWLTPSKTIYHLWFISLVRYVFDTQVNTINMMITVLLDDDDDIILFALVYYVLLC